MRSRGTQCFLSQYRFDHLPPEARNAGGSNVTLVFAFRSAIIASFRYASENAKYCARSTGLLVTRAFAASSAALIRYRCAQFIPTLLHRWLGGRPTCHGLNAKKYL